MRRLLVLAPLVGCGTNGIDPGIAPPIVTHFEASSGEYDATITIEGSGFGIGRDGGATLLYTRPGDTEPRPYTPWREQISAWTDERIVFDVAFPISGTISIQNEGGATEAGTFEPSTWTPGPSVHLPELQLADLYALDETRVAALGRTADGTHLVVFGATSVTDYKLALTESVLQAKLARSSSGDPEALLRTQHPTTGQITVWHMQWNGGPQLVDTGLGQRDPQIARGPSGLHVWIELSNQGYARAAPPTWAPSATIPKPDGPVNAPRLCAAGGDAMFAFDVVHHGTSVEGRKLELYRLPPGGTQLELIHQKYDEHGLSAARFIAGDDGGSVAYRYCYDVDGYWPWSPDTTKCYQAAYADGELWGYTQEGVTFVVDPRGGFGASHLDTTLRDSILAKPVGGYLTQPIPYKLFRTAPVHGFITPSGQARALVEASSLDEFDKDRFYVPVRR